MCPGLVSELGAPVFCLWNLRELQMGRRCQLKKRKWIHSNLISVPMINCLCCVPRAFRDGKFLFYRLTFVCNRIWGNADLMLLLVFFLIAFGFTGPLPKLSWMLLLPFQVTEVWGKENNVLTCIRVVPFVLLLFLCGVLKFSLTKISALCHFCRP